MSFLRSPFARELPPVLTGSRVVLRTPEMGDYAAWSNLRLESRDFLVPWEPLWSVSDLTKGAFRSRVKQYQRDITDDFSYPFFIFSGDGRTLMGAATLSNVRRGVAQMATLGYWIGAPFARRGFMTDAVQTLLPFVFDHLSLHRLEAACLPRNAASIALLKRCGFHQEGLAQKYLRINGEWQDHLLFARFR